MIKGVLVNVLMIVGQKHNVSWDGNIITHGPNRYAKLRSTTQYHLLPRYRRSNVKTCLDLDKSAPYCVFAQKLTLSCENPPSRLKTVLRPPAPCSALPASTPQCIIVRTKRHDEMEEFTFFNLSIIDRREQ